MRCLKASQSIMPFDFDGAASRTSTKCCEHGVSRPSTKYCALGSKQATHALVFLHGWKMTGSNMRSSFRSCIGNSLLDTVVYFLTANETVNGNGEEPEWFAYRTNDRLAFVPESLVRTRQRLHQIMHRLYVRHRRRGGSVSIGGYSQGACTAIDVALTLGVPMKVLLFSGFAMLPQLVSAFGWHGYQPSRVPLSIWAFQYVLAKQSPLPGALAPMNPRADHLCS